MQAACLSSNRNWKLVGAGGSVGCGGGGGSVLVPVGPSFSVLLDSHHTITDLPDYHSHILLPQELGIHLPAAIALNKSNVQMDQNLGHTALCGGRLLP